MTLSADTKLGPYAIRSLLGTGGMGEVYRAYDSRLERDVAIKILPESLARDPERLQRFKHEAHAVAALNHPNILAIYDVGQHDGVPYLVVELIEGKSLRTLIDEGTMSQRRVIDYGVQIAQGLAAAHEKSFIHRDLKPENLFITRDGRAKILDFGLAKLAQKPVASSDAVTMTSSGTAAGVVMGTASYMAPEQVRSEAVDARTDIFALGAVLWEMLTGQQVFHRDTAAETMTAVLRDDLPDSITQRVSPALERIVRRCLEKDPDQRFQSARDLSFALGVLSGSDTSGAAHAAEALLAFRRARVGVWASLAAVAVLAVTAAWFFARSTSTTQRMEYAISVSAEVSHPALSADGRMLAFVSPNEKTGLSMIHIQQVGSVQVTELPGTEGASYPFWSPNGEYLAFFAKGKLQKIAAKGGSPQTLAQTSYARGGSWGTKNVILYTPAAGGPIWRVNHDGSDARPATDGLSARVNSHRWPLFLPDGEHFLFLDLHYGTEAASKTWIHLSSLDEKTSKPLIKVASNPGYAAGHLFYVDDKKALRTIGLDPDSGQVSGEARLVVDSLGFQPSVSRGSFTVAENGTLVYSSGTTSAHSLLSWFGRGGEALGHVGGAVVQANPALSPSGDRVVVDVTDLKANNLDIWIQDMRRQTSMRLTFDTSEDTCGVWSRDGQLLAYRLGSEAAVLAIKDARGLTASREVTRVEVPSSAFVDAYDLLPNSWSRDGKQILAAAQTRSSGSKLVLVDVATGNAKPFLSGSAPEATGQISPDGKWVAYASSESGDWEVYVTTFPDATGKWQVSRDGGNEPRWRGDGKEIFYLGPTNQLMATPVDTGDTFSSGAPVPLFQVRGRAPISSSDMYTYDVASDGQRFLVNQYVKPQQVAPLRIVLNSLADPPQ